MTRCCHIGNTSSTGLLPKEVTTAALSTRYIADMATDRPAPPSGLYLTEHRERHRKTLEEVAKVCRVNRSTVSKWETGKLRIYPIAQRLFAKALGIEPEDLWRHPDDPGPEDRARSRLLEQLGQHQASE